METGGDGRELAGLALELALGGEHGGDASGDAGHDHLVTLISPVAHDRAKIGESAGRGVRIG